MLTRPCFLKIATAGLATVSFSQRTLAATPYSIDGEYRYGTAGLVRSVIFPRTSERKAVQFTFACLIGDRVKAAIVEGSQLAIRGLQLWQIADQRHAIVAVNGGFQLRSYWYDGLLVIDATSNSAEEL